MCIKRTHQERRNSMLSDETINELLGINESYQAPARLLELMLDDEKRTETFNEFLKYEHDLSYEWFKFYFEDEHADRKKKKQDFTPQCVSKLLAKLTGGGNHYHEVAVGTGSILIGAWHEERLKSTPLTYDPRNYWYHAEELSDRAIPFLIFNMSIRGMNGVILHGDSLTREFKDVYFIRNDSDDYQAYSEVVIMPKTDALKRELDIYEWI